MYEVKDKWLKKKEQDLSVPDHVFQEWRRRWEDPDYRKRCEKQSGNCRSERAGEGSGMSTHTCGSRSMREHERALVLFLIYTSYAYYFVNCVQLCLFFISQKDFFSIELTYVLFVIKDTQGG